MQLQTFIRCMGTHWDLLKCLKMVKLHGLVKAMSRPQLIRIEDDTQLGKALVQPLPVSLLTVALQSNFFLLFSHHLFLPEQEKTRTNITQLLDLVGISEAHALCSWNNNFTTVLQFYQKGHFISYWITKRQPSCVYNSWSHGRSAPSSVAWTEQNPCMNWTLKTSLKLGINQWVK